MMTIEKLVPNARNKRDQRIEEKTAIAVNQLIDLTTAQAVEEANTPLNLTQVSSGNILVFNDAADAALNIPDGLEIGTSVIVLNIGTGAVSTTMLGSEILRGNPVLSDTDSFMSVTKITATLWQSSERV